DCPKGVRPIGTKWVLKNKKDERWIVFRNKTRLVAQGYIQEEGIDYDEVFSPGARIKAIRLFLAYASFMGFTFYQMDAKSAFLYGTIDEEVYVMQPPGFQDLEFPVKVYKVKKAMYGLHQAPRSWYAFPSKVYKVEKAMYGLHKAPRAWYGTLSKYLLKNSFQKGTIDQTLFIRRQREDFILVQVYMDDIIFGSSNPQLCREFKALMHEKFQMSAMGELNFFLGTSKYWGVLRILMISLRLIPLSEHNVNFHPMVDFVEASPLRRTRIAQSSVLPPVADDPTSLLRDVNQGEACPTDSGFIADQDRATIAKSSTLPYDSAPRVTSPAADEGSMQQTFNELTALCTSLQRQHSEMIAKFKAQEEEINRLKARVKLLEDREGMVAERSGDNALIKGRNLDEGEAAAKRVSDDSEEMATVLTSMDAATVLACGVVEVPTSSGSIPTASPPADEVPTGSDVVPTDGLIFATATVVTSYTRRKGNEVMVESETPKKKKVQEQVDIQMARHLEEEMEREDQRMSEHIARDTEVARIHVKEELQSMIDGLDRSNVTVAKYLQEYQQFASELPLERRIELISDFVRLKRNGLSLEQESVKKLKTSEEVTEEAKSPDEVPEEKTSKDKEIFMLVEKDYPLRKGLALVMIWYKLQVENYSQMVNDLILKICKIANSPRQQEESSDSEEEGEEHLALTVFAPALHSSIPASENSDETEPFEEGETAATPPPFRYRVPARISVQPHILLPFRSDESVLKVDMPLRKRARFTTPTGGYEVGESSVAAAARHIRPALTIADGRRAKDRLIGKVRRERRYFRTLFTTYAKEVAHSRDYCTQIMDY
nr:copia protein [Tanacetum cinerariifolium]